MAPQWGVLIVSIPSYILLLLSPCHLYVMQGNSGLCKGTKGTLTTAHFSVFLPSPLCYAGWAPVCFMLCLYSSCSLLFLPPLPSSHPGTNTPLGVMLGEHQLGRRNSRPCRGQLLLHTTLTLCRLFSFSFSAAYVFGSECVFFKSVFVHVFIFVLYT